MVNNKKTRNGLHSILKNLDLTKINNLKVLFLLYETNTQNSKQNKM